jgi:hypothetical protein
VWNRGSASGPVNTGGTLHGETHSVSIGVSPGAVSGLLPGANPFLVASHHIANRPTDAANLGQVARVDSDIEHRTHTPINATHANQMTRRGVRTQPQPVATRCISSPQTYRAATDPDLQILSRASCVVSGDVP